MSKVTLKRTERIGEVETTYTVTAEMEHALALMRQFREIVEVDIEPPPWRDPMKAGVRKNTA
jgi:hypothetical protein